MLSIISIVGAVGGIYMQKRGIRRGWRVFWSIAAIICIVAAVSALACGIALGVYIRNNYSSQLDLTLFEASARGGTTKLYYYDENGDAVELTSERLEGGSCIYMEYDELPRQLIDAFVAIEDKRFWRHSGVDWKRTAHAALNYALHDSVSFGGSTITQQLIKNITGERDVTTQRKLQEMIWAKYLEACMTKEQIIELYLNIINLSRGCVGVQAAANTYFSKDVSELTLAECATIAAITNNPSYYDPVRHPENNIRRRDLILDQMLAQGYIDEQQHAAAVSAPLELDMTIRQSVQNVNSWYTDMVIEDVIDGLCSQYGYNPQSASVLIYSGALRIYTAMDIDIQTVVEQYFADASNFPESKDGNPFQASMIIIDPVNGDILGVAGGVGEKAGDRVQNYATQTRRPSGSVIKPLSVYAPALDAGLITMGTVYDDVPVSFNHTDSGTYSPWPKNSPNVYRGLTNISVAVRDSVNTVAVRVLEQLGVDASFDFLYNRLGMHSLISSEVHADGTVLTDRGIAALALGQQNYGVTVREVTGGYTALAGGGVYNAPRSYYKVTDSRGNVLLINEQSEGTQVLSEQTAALMTIMLENVVTSGTAAAITLDRHLDVAGKTGTTQDNCDKWFVGYTPYLIGGVWCGYEYPESLSGVNNPCVEVWDKVMTVLHQKYLAASDAVTEFTMPSGISSRRVCGDSGKLLTSACRSDARGNRGVVCYYVAGSEPTAFCDCHTMVNYDIVGGGVATDECPVGGVSKVGMIQVRRSFPVQIYVTDAQYVWRRITGESDFSHDPGEAFFAPLIPDGTWCGISRAAKQYNRGCEQHNGFE